MITTDIARKIYVNIIRVTNLDVEIINDLGVVVVATDSRKEGIQDNYALESIQSGAKTAFEDKLINTDSSTSRLMIPIVFHSKTVGIICTIGFLDDSIKHKVLVKTIAELVLDSRSICEPRIEKSSLIKSIINNQLDPIHLSHSITGLRSDAHFAVIVFDISQKTRERELSQRELQEILLSIKREFDEKLIEVINPTQIVMLMKVNTSAVGGQDAVIRKVDSGCDVLRRLEWLAFNAACGECYQGLERLHESYQSAIYSLYIGKSMLAGKDIYSYREMAVDVLLLLNKNNWAAENLLQRYGALVSNDKGGVLQKTLKGLFDAKLNVKEAANNLCVHQNTLRYRMEKIQGYTGMMLNDIDNIYVLYSAFKLHHISNAKTDMLALN